MPYIDTGLNLTAGAVNTIQVRFKTGTGTGDVDIWLNNDTQGSPSYNGSGSMSVGTGAIDRVLTGLAYAPEAGYSTTYYDDYTIDSAFIAGSGGNSAPTAPTTLYTEGQSNPTNITDPTPEFSALYNDPDAGDLATQYRLQVSASSTSWTTFVWDSGIAVPLRWRQRPPGSALPT